MITLPRIALAAGHSVLIPSNLKERFANSCLRLLSTSDCPRKWNKLSPLFNYLSTQQTVVNSVGLSPFRDKLEKEVEQTGQGSAPVDISDKLRRLGLVTKFLDGLGELTARTQELDELHSLAVEEADPELLTECEDMLEDLEAEIRERQITECMRTDGAEGGIAGRLGSLMGSRGTGHFSHHTQQSHRQSESEYEYESESESEYESESVSCVNNSDCFLQIQVGAGGDDACEWVAMLRSMYYGWCAEHGYSVEIVEEAGGDNSVGLRGVTMKISSNCEGQYPYGWLRAEAGVHRLVRISPFDPLKKRHTSFAMVLLYPDCSRNADLMAEEQLRPEHFEVQTFRSSGPGGQSVNTTDSAVRIVHRSSGLSAVCQNERSQAMNKKAALALLRAKVLRQLQTEAARTRRDSIIGNDSPNSFGGGHVRSVVLHPYALAKDHRTGWERTSMGEVEAYLSGRGDTLQTALERLLFWRTGAGPGEDSWER